MLPIQEGLTFAILFQVLQLFDSIEEVWALEIDEGEKKPPAEDPFSVPF